MVIKHCGACGHEWTDEEIRAAWERQPTNAPELHLWTGECVCGSGDCAYEINGRMLTEREALMSGGTIFQRIFQTLVILAACMLPFGCNY